MGIKELNDILKSKQVPQVILFYGTEDYLRNFYSTALADILVPDKDDFANRVVLSENLSLETIKDTCDELPFFSEHKVVIIKDSGLLKGKATGDWDFVKSMDPSIKLIISEREVDARGKGYKLLTQHAFCCELGEQDQVTREKWLAKRLRSQGVLADADIIRRIVELCDTDMYTLANESDKLIAYAGAGGQITLEDVDALCTASIKSVVFDLTDAVSTGRPDRAYQVLEDMRQLREADQKLFITMAGHISKMLRYRLMLEKGTTDTEINAVMKMHLYAFRKMSSQSKRFSTATLREMHKFCVDADEKSKGGYLDAGKAMELLIAMAGSKQK